MRFVSESMPPEAPAHLREIAQAFPQNALALYEDGAPVAWSCHVGMPGSLRATAFLWVAPARRRQGLGSALLCETFSRMKERGVGEAMCHFVEDATLDAFARKNGMAPGFSTEHLTYAGGPLPERAPFAVYTDADYPEFQALQSAAFYDLRRRIGVEPYALPPSPEMRAQMARQAERYFLLREEGEVVAAGSIFEDEVDDVVVAARCRGRGLGAQVTAHAVNLLLARGVAPALWCVVGNPARAMYLRLGFRPAETEGYYRKAL